MIKKNMACLLLFGMLFGLCSCHRLSTLDNTKYYEAYEIVYRNVPAYHRMGMSYSAQFDTVKLLDTDHYGRQLFEYCSDGDLLSEQMISLVICQKTQDGMVYYYEDVCWISRLKSAEEFSDNEVNNLKEQNDWNQSLSESKMSSTPYGKDNHTELVLSESEREATLAMIEECFQLNEGTEILYRVFYHAQSYYMVLTVLNTQEDLAVGEHQSDYKLVLFHEERGIVSFQDVDDPLNCQDEIKALKEKMSESLQKEMNLYTCP